jgi:hypothetical protein
VAEGARLESVYTGNRIVGSNPTPSARVLSTPFSAVRSGFQRGLFWPSECLPLDSGNAESGKIALAYASFSEAPYFCREYGFSGALNFSAFCGVPARSNLNRTR